MGDGVSCQLEFLGAAEKRGFCGTSLKAQDRPTDIP